jgi:hypothetical protein
MAYFDGVNLIEGDIAVVQQSQNSLEMADSPRVFQFNNQEPHVIAKENLGSGVGAVSTVALAYSPDGKYLVWVIGQRVIIYNLDTGVIRDTATGVTPSNPSFTGNSKTVLFATSTAPFIIAVDLYSGDLRGTITGTYTFTNGNARGSSYQGKCYLINSGLSTGSYSIYEYDDATNEITTIATTNYQYGYIACSESGQFMVAINGSTTTSGPLTYIYDLTNLAAEPKTFASSAWRNGAGNAEICKYGTGSQNFMMLLNHGSVLRLVSLFKGATLEDYTMTAVNASGLISPNNTNIYAKDNFGFIYCGHLSTLPPYSESRPIAFIDLRTYINGQIITPSILPGVNAKYANVAVSPRFTIRRLAGTVRSETTALVARKVVVFNRRTMRKIAETTSDAGSGAFTIPIYNGEQCIVMAIGKDNYSSKLIDYVAPVV